MRTCSSSSSSFNSSRNFKPLWASRWFSSLVICWERPRSLEIVLNRWKENAQCWAAHLRCKLVEASFYKCSQQQSHHFTIHLSPRDRNTSLLKHDLLSDHEALLSWISTVTILAQVTMLSYPLDFAFLRTQSQIDYRNNCGFEMFVFHPRFQPGIQIEIVIFEHTACCSETEHALHTDSYCKGNFQSPSSKWTLGKLKGVCFLLGV